MIIIATRIGPMGYRTPEASLEQHCHFHSRHCDVSAADKLRSTCRRETESAVQRTTRWGRGGGWWIVVVSALPPPDGPLRRHCQACRRSPNHRISFPGG